MKGLGWVVVIGYKWILDATVLDKRRARAIFERGMHETLMRADAPGRVMDEMKRKTLGRWRETK